ncbi:MAG: Crp/Fnr family transcriptional regulator [Bacteroidetes bacterium]|nr:MAG: Crp/Fnr family transcriptional regulator [Bacteroidota bacterium]
MLDVLRENFGHLFEDELLVEISRVSKYTKVDAGDTLMELGSSVTHMPLLIEGAIKIFRLDDDYREQILYFLERGDTCALTLNCCVGKVHSEIKAVAEVDSELIFVPAEYMETFLKYHSWSKFVFDSFNNRLVELLEVIDSLAFMKLDERLYNYLRDKVLINSNQLLEITHSIIAQEMNTSRVVISRVLKKLELENKIKLHRNKIEVIEI